MRAERCRDPWRDVRIDFAFERQNVGSINCGHNGEATMSLLRQSSIASPPELLHHGFDLGKIVKNKIGLLLRQPFARA